MSLVVAILIVLAAGGLAALALAFVSRTTRGPLLADSGRGRPMIQVTGTVFAVVLAFVILAAFQTYNDAKTGAESEAAAVLDMARTANLFPPTERDRLRADFLCYGRAVVDHEWPAMRDGHSSPLVDHWIEEYRAAFRRFDLNSARQRIGLQELLTLADTRTAGRLQRLSDATPTVPTPLWLALVFVGCMAVALQLGMVDPRERLRIHGPMIAAMASVVAAGLLIVYFLDHPYQGHVGDLEPTAMRRTVALIENVDPNLPARCGKTGRPV